MNDKDQDWVEVAPRKFQGDQDIHLTGLSEHGECLAKVVNKAERHILRPILAEYNAFSRRPELGDLGRYAVEHLSRRNCSPENYELRFFKGIAEAGRQLGEQSGVQDEIFNLLIKSSSQTYPRFCIRERVSGIKSFIFAQIGLIAIREGWVICIADESTSEIRLYSQVDYHQFSTRMDGFELKSPKDFNAYGITNLETSLHLETGSETLLTVLTCDLLRFRDGVATGPRSATKRADEQVLSNALTRIRANHPNKKARRSDVIKILREVFGISAKAAKRVWEAADTGHWSNRGAPKQGGVFAPNELTELLTRVKKS